MKKARKKMLMKLTEGANFINVLQAALGSTDDNLTVFLYFRDLHIQKLLVKR